VKWSATIGALFLAGLTACGVTAGNPGSGGKTHDRLSIYGSVQTLERTEYSPMRIGVYDGYGQEVTYAMSASNSTYYVDGLEPGAYWVKIGDGYREPLQLEKDTLLNVILPLPAAPAHFRFVDLGPSDFCLLWSDHSAVEQGYRIVGPHEAWEGPANAIGVRLYLPNAIDHATTESVAEAALAWSAEFGGSYSLAAWNGYGPSGTAAVNIAAYDASTWNLLSPPPEPPLSDGNPEKEICLSVERSADQPQFIEP
jgi:hypothetical protein